MCIFHIKQTRLASVFTSACTFPRLFFNITTKYLCNLLISKLVKRNTEEHPGFHTSGILSELAAVVTVNMTKLSSWQTRYYTDTADTSSDRPRQHQKLWDWPNLQAQGSDGLFGGCRNQITFPFSLTPPISKQDEFGPYIPAFLYIFRH